MLGTASGLPTEHRFSQTTAIEYQGGLHLLDVADGASAFMRRQGLHHNAIRSITISHMHGDHHSGLIQVLKTNMHLGRREPLRIFLPSEALNRYQEIMELCYLVPEWMGYQIEWRAIRVDQDLDLGDGLALRAFPNDHLQHLRQRAETLDRIPESWRFESYSFLLQKAPYVVAYSGNLKSSLKEMVPWANGVDVLISELAHLKVDDCIKALQIIRPRLAIFAHVSPERDQGCPALRSRAVPGVRVFVAEDGDIYNIDELVGSSSSPTAPLLNKCVSLEGAN